MAGVVPDHYDVFLSHSGPDKAAVEELARRLKRDGIEPFLDKWNLIPGDPWQEPLEEALINSAACAVFIGPGGFSPWHNEELRTAIEHRVSASRGRYRVIPVLLPGASRLGEEKLPPLLRRTTWVQFSRTLDDAEAFRRLVCGIRGIEPGGGPNGPPFEGQCPYRGLEPFRPEHAPFFFGREAQIDWLLENRLTPMGRSGHAQRFLAILGPSGSGKSSLALAGLVPALRAGEVEGSATWPIAILRPGYDPFENLTFEPLEAQGPGRLRPGPARSDVRVPLGPGLRRRPPAPAHLRPLCPRRRARRPAAGRPRGPVRGGLHPVPRRARAGPPGLHRHPAPCRDRRRWPGPRAADPAGRLPRQVRLLSRPGRRPLGRPGARRPDGWRRAASGHRAAGLPGRLRAPAGADGPAAQGRGGSGGGLAALAVRAAGVVDAARGPPPDHRSLPGHRRGPGALEQQADEVVKDLKSDAEREICRRIFLRLTQPGEGTEDTKRRAPFRELLDSAGDAPLVEKVIYRLADARLIATEGRGRSPQEGDGRDQESYVEVAHEALIRGWPQLRRWIDADRAGLRLHRQLTEAAREWKGHAGDASFLFQGTRLAVAREWAEAHPQELNPWERAFLEASVQQEQQRQADEVAAARRLAEEAEARRQAEEARGREAERREREQAASAKRLRRRAWFLFAISAAALLIAVIAALGWGEAKKQTAMAQRQMRIARSRRLAAMATAELGRRYDLALLLSVAALQFRDPTDDAFEARRSLFTALSARPGLITFLHHDDNHIITSVAFSPDGKTLAVGQGGGVVLYDVAGRRRLGDPLAVPEGGVGSVAFSPDGKALAAGYAVGFDAAVLRGGVVLFRGGVVLYDVAGRRRLGDPLAVPEGDVGSVAFSPDGKALAAGYSTVAGGGVVLYDVAGRRRLGDPLAVPEGGVGSVAFSPDGKALAAGYSVGAGGGVVLYDVVAGRR